MVLFLQRVQLLRRDLLLLDLLEIDAGVGVGGAVVLLAALFADQKQGPGAVVKALVLKRLLDEFCLTGFDKPGEDIDRNLHAQPP